MLQMGSCIFITKDDLFDFRVMQKNDFHNYSITSLKGLYNEFGHRKGILYTHELWNSIIDKVNEMIEDVIVPKYRSGIGENVFF
jgi:hypothetical protein